MAQAKNKLDFSLETVPERWFEAARESGQTDAKPLPRARPAKAVPHGQRADPFAALLAGVAMCLAAGVGWFLLEVEGGVVSPWTPTVMGLLVGASVRLGAGRRDPGVRSIISLALFLITTTVVSFLVVRWQLSEGHLDSSVAFAERAFLRHRVYDATYAGTTSLGALLAIRANYLAIRDS